MKKLIFILIAALTTFNCVAQIKITVIFNDITKGEIDTLFFQVDKFTTQCEEINEKSIHQINAPIYNENNSDVDNSVYLPMYDISWEAHPIMGNIITWSEFNNKFECIALYLYNKKDLYLSK